MRVARKVAPDHTVSREGNRRGVPREEVCAELRGAQVEIERRLDGSHWLRFGGRYLRLRTARNQGRARQVLPAYGLQDLSQIPLQNYKNVPPNHPWRTFQYGRKLDISTLR